jgi:hypothetical protein
MEAERSCETSCPIELYGAKSQKIVLFIIIYSHKSERDREARNNSRRVGKTENETYSILGGKCDKEYCHVICDYRRVSYYFEYFSVCSICNKHFRLFVSRVHICILQTFRSVQRMKDKPLASNLYAHIRACSTINKPTGQQIQKLSPPT